MEKKISMPFTVQVREQGASLVISLPKDVASANLIKKGDYISFPEFVMHTGSDLILALNSTMIGVFA